VTPKRFTFVLRLWTETDLKIQPILRGSLEVVESHRVHYFSSLDQIPDILQKVTGWQGRPDPGRDEEVNL
jgi:hypothetical protein